MKQLISGGITRCLVVKIIKLHEILGGECIVQEKVSQLIDRANLKWDLRALQFQLPTEEIAAISRSHVMVVQRLCRLVWPFEKNRHLSIKSTYSFIRARKEKAGRRRPSSSRTFSTAIWNLHVLAKIRNFPWKVNSNIMPIPVNIARRGVVIEPLYCFYNQVATKEHMLFHYRRTRMIWFGEMGLRFNTMFIASRDRWIEDVLESCKMKGEERIVWLRRLAYILWHTWKERSVAVFEHSEPHAQKVMLRVGRDV